MTTQGALPQPRTALDDAPQGAVDEAVIVAHLPLVEYALNDLRGRLPAHVDHDELRSAGRLALVQAGKGFDPSRGVPFARFASRRIAGAMVDELRKADWASRSVRARARERSTAEGELTATLGRRPAPLELADRMGVSVRELHAVEDDLHRALVLSLQAFESPGSVDAVVSAREPSPEAAFLATERTGLLVDAVAALPERLRTVVTALFFEERTTAEVAAELGVTESRVSQVKTQALALLRDGISSAEGVTQLGRGGGCVERRRADYFAAVSVRNAKRNGRTEHGIVA